MNNHHHGSSTPRTRAIMRLSHPLAFAQFLNHIGGPSQQIFRRSGLPTLCDDPNVFVPVNFAWLAFDLAARAEDPEIAWHVGNFVHEQQLNAGLLQRIESTPTLYQGLQEFVRLISSEASDLRLTIEEYDDHILLCTCYPTFKTVIGYDSSQAYQLPVYLSVIQRYLGPNWFPDEIGVEAKKLPRAAKKFFPGTRIRTRAPYGYVKIPRNLLCTPAIGLPDANVSSPALTKDLNYCDILRTLLIPYLNQGYPDTGLAAKLMGTSERTLFRRIAEAGTTYRQLVDELRFETAKSLLRESTNNICQISTAVGFDDQSHFTRMFRRIGGVTPSAYRQMFN